MIDHKITKGLSIINKKKAFTDHSFDSGMLDFLFSTPAMVSMVIEGSSKMLDKLLPEDYTTVGKRIDISHEKPTIIGEPVTVVITVTKVEDNTIYLDVIAHDEVGLIGIGKHERIIVNRQKMIDSARSRAEKKALS